MRETGCGMPEWPDLRMRDIRPTIRPVRMQPTRIRLFIKPYCGWCIEAMGWLDRQGVPYQKLDVIADPHAFREMRRLSGQTLAPVLEADGHVLADFGARELEAWWHDRGYSRVDDG